MFGLGVPELLIILIIILLLFGANRLPKLVRSIGESARELKEGLEGDQKSRSETDVKDKPKTKRRPSA